MATPLKHDDVLEKLEFARRRLKDLLELNRGNLPGADSSERQQLLQEFFFHLIGVVDLSAQLLNEKRGLGLKSDKLTIGDVFQALTENDAARAILKTLHAQPRTASMPDNPYSEDAYVYRAYNYRHQVTHRRRNPFLFRVGSQPAASFYLDPRADSQTPSSEAAQDEMKRMLDVFERRCHDLLAAL